MTDVEKLILHNLRHLTSRVESLHKKVDKLNQSKSNSIKALKSQNSKLKKTRVNAAVLKNLAKKVTEFLDKPITNHEHQIATNRDYKYLSGTHT